LYLVLSVRTYDCYCTSSSGLCLNVIVNYELDDAILAQARQSF
jgi:hypothetical protein